MGLINKYLKWDVLMRYVVMALSVVCLLGPLMLFGIALLSINIIELYDRILGQER